MSKATTGLSAGLTLVLAAVLIIAAQWTPGSIRGHGAAQVVKIAAPAPTPVAPTPSAPTIPHDLVAPAAPTSFVIKGPAFKVKANVCQMPYIRPLDPPGDQHHTVCWVDKDFGVAPGSNASGTSYILGHAWSESPLEVLNPLSIYAMNHVNMAKPVPQSGVPTYPVSHLTGYTITLGTPHGTLTYAVTEAFAVSKEQAALVADIMNTAIPNRIVLITCGVHNGQDIDVNVIVYAYLQSSVAS